MDLPSFYSTLVNQESEVRHHESTESVGGRRVYVLLYYYTCCDKNGVSTSLFWNKNACERGPSFCCRSTKHDEMVRVYVHFWPWKRFTVACNTSLGVVSIELDARILPLTQRPTSPRIPYTCKVEHIFLRNFSLNNICYITFQVMLFRGTNTYSFYE